MQFNLERRAAPGERKHAFDVAVSLKFMGLPFTHEPVSVFRQLQ
jgi:hypothetical protein